MKRMKKAGLVATSMATIAVCSSLIVGSTYALFTSEDNVNIAVTAGKVSVTAEIDESSLVLTSMGVTQDGSNWANGGSAGFSDKQKLDLTYITPGDGATFDIKVTNESNVNVLYRVIWSISGELSDVLETSVDGVAKFGAWTEWTAPKTEAEKVKTISVSVALPEEVGNDYQEKVASISFALEAYQANATVESNAYYVNSGADLLEAVALANESEAASTIYLSNDIEVTSLTNIPAGTVIDGNGNKITDSTGNLNVSKDVEYRNIVFDIDGGWHGVITNSAKFYNCTFDGTTPYITPTASDIVFDGCTFIDNVLQICFNEGQKIDPSTINTTITNNTFMVNNTDIKAHAIVIGGGSADFWANGAETITLSGNTFNSRYENIYIAYFIYGNEQLTGVPVYLDNTYNGAACYSINKTDVEYQYDFVPGFVYNEDAGVYKVLNANGLRRFAALVNGGNDYKGKTIVLASDIDLNNAAYTPIGVGAKYFAGTFDGGNHTVSNINIAETDMYAGLFGYTNGATIKNINVNNVKISAKLDNQSSTAMGGIVARPHTGKIDNCSVINIDFSEAMAKYMGGISGYGYATISNCYVKSELKPYSCADMGGIIGMQNGKFIENCYADVDISGGFTIAGGITAFTNYSEGAKDIKNCYVTGTLVGVDNGSTYGDSFSVGGIVGYGYGITITNCYCDATVSKNQMIAANCAGDNADFVGNNKEEYKLVDCSWTGVDSYSWYGYQNADGSKTGGCIYNTETPSDNCTYSAGMSYKDYKAVSVG